MRRAFAETLAELARNDPRIVLLTGDLGFMALEPFAQSNPGQFFNVGVAEQNMAGVATGLAEAGYIPFIYSIVNFAVMRPFEFIRNGAIAQKLPIRVVSVGGGFEYGNNGISHYGLEDVALMRTQPGMTVICPCDAGQARQAIRSTWSLPGPVYYRLGKDDRIIVPGLDGRFELGSAQIIHEGADVLIVAMGAIAIEAVDAVGKLKEHGVSATVMVVNSFNPSPADDLVDQLRKFKTVISLEAHYVDGALGSWVAEVIAERGVNCRLVRCGVKKLPSCHSGSQRFMHETYQISGAQVARLALEVVNKL